MTRYTLYCIVLHCTVHTVHTVALRASVSTACVWPRAPVLPTGSDIAISCIATVVQCMTNTSPYLDISILAILLVQLKSPPRSLPRPRIYNPDKLGTTSLKGTVRGEGFMVPLFHAKQSYIPTVGRAFLARSRFEADVGGFDSVAAGSHRTPMPPPLPPLAN